jgi:hypothetical protein
MTCTEAINEVFENENGVLNTNDVIAKIYSKYPDQPWKKNTISHHLVGLSVNHPSSRHLSIRKHAFLFSLGNGRYRRWNQEQDGEYIVTDTGVELEDEGQDAIEEPGEEIEQDNSSIGTSVSLERDLENYIVANLGSLEPGLTLYEENGSTGNQYDTNVVGILDILAIDNKGNFVIVELKAGKVDEKVCGQILRYMGWVKREIAKEKLVRGIIVANDFHEIIKYAVDAMPNVILKKYAVHFELHDL